MGYIKSSSLDKSTDEKRKKKSTDEVSVGGVEVQGLTEPTSI